MRGSWQEVVDSVLRPARPHLVRCLRERENHLAQRRAGAEERARAKKHCEWRIERAREAVFAANDGIISAVMTDLEREWRRLSRSEADDGLMDLWARVAPSSWIDRKRFRDSEGAVRLDAAIALASDVDGVEAAESAVRALRATLAPWGATIGPRVRWRLGEQDSAHCSELLAGPLRTAKDAIARHRDEAVFERAERFERNLWGAVLARFPERPLLAHDVSHAAFVDHLWHAAELPMPSPVEPLRELWTTGYVLAGADAAGVTLDIPRISHVSGDR